MHKSTGNDIVDLRSVNKTRTSEPRFYSKIISVQEKELSYKLPDLNLSFEIFVWLAWSVKESVYKFLKRHESELVFSPIKIELQDIVFADDAYYGMVMFRSELLYYRTQVTGQWVHSVVNADECFAQVKCGVKLISPANNDERLALARQFLLDEVKEALGENIAISKSISGYPVISKNSKELDIPVSLSHDGNYVGYSIHIETYEILITS